MDNSSGVGVLDKAAVVLGALEAGPGHPGRARGRPPASPARPRTGSPSPWSTTGWSPATCRAGSSSARGWPSWPPPPARTACWPPPGRCWRALRDITGESAQLYRRQGDQRVCVAAAERPIGLRDTDPGRRRADHARRLGRPGAARLGGPRPAAPRACRTPRSPRPTLSGVRRRGWAQSVGEREPGVASVSAPVRGPSGRVVAAVSVSGPIERLTRQPGRLHAAAVVAAAANGSPRSCAVTPSSKRPDQTSRFAYDAHP